MLRKLDAKGVVFIEYAPLETTWVPVEGENYLYIYCLLVTGDFKGKGHGRQLMEYCLADAKAKGKSGVCMLGAEKQKALLLCTWDYLLLVMGMNHAMAIEKAALEGGSIPEFCRFIEEKSGRKIQNIGG